MTNLTHSFNSKLINKNDTCQFPVRLLSRRRRLRPHITEKSSWSKDNNTHIDIQT